MSDVPEVSTEQWLELAEILVMDTAVTDGEHCKQSYLILGDQNRRDTGKAICFVFSFVVRYGSRVGFSGKNTLEDCSTIGQKSHIILIIKTEGFPIFLKSLCNFMNNLEQQTWISCPLRSENTGIWRRANTVALLYWRYI